MGDGRVGRSYNIVDSSMYSPLVIFLTVSCGSGVPQFANIWAGDAAAPRVVLWRFEEGSHSRLCLRFLCCKGASDSTDSRDSELDELGEVDSSSESVGDGLPKLAWPVSWISCNISSRYCGVSEDVPVEGVSVVLSGAPAESSWAGSLFSR